MFRKTTPNNGLKKAIFSLIKLDTISTIENELRKKSIEEIDICFPITKSEIDKIHLLADTRKKLTFFDLAELSATIKEILQCDNVIIQHKSLFDEEKLQELFIDFTPFKQNNVTNVQFFFKRNYPQYFTEKTFSPSREKLQESFQEASSTKEAEELHETKSSHIDSEEVITWLKENKGLWAKLTSEPAAWGNIQQQIQEELEISLSEKKQSLTAT